MSKQQLKKQKEQKNKEVYVDINVYSQSDLNNIINDFNGVINIYGGDRYDPIIVNRSWENASVVARGNASVELNGYAQARICSESVKYKTEGKSRIILPLENIDDYINYFGVKDVGDSVIMYKAVHKCGDTYFANRRPDFIYKIGETATEKGIDRNVYHDCGAGLHVSTLDWALRFGDTFENLAIIECEVPKDQIVVYKFSDGKIRTSELKVLREVPLNECGVYGKILARKMAR